MAKRPEKSHYVLKNAKKYFGKHPIVCRSSWERSACSFFDNSPAVLGWSAESYEIQYKNPITNRWTVYIPDYFIVTMNRQGKTEARMIEVKPLKEAVVFNESGDWAPAVKARSKETQAAQIVNAAKWMAARAWCKKNGVEFVVLTEKEIYAWSKS